MVERFAGAPSHVSLSTSALPGSAAPFAPPAPTTSVAAHGPLLFAQYAYAPNSLGYCGPHDSRALLEYGASGAVDGGLVQLARGFEGAWPYLELIARATGLRDPLDVRVVEAYWLGNDLLDQIDFRVFGASLMERFRRRAGRTWGYLAEAIPLGAAPNHSFHVFGVYPWVGLLRGERAELPLTVLDRCRIRWGEVVDVRGDEVAVLSRPLVFEGWRLKLGEPRVETAKRSIGGVGFVDELRPGDTVSLHWHWVCDRLSRRQLANLRRQTLRQLHVANDLVSHPGPAAAMG
jgi:hypothetical protein